MDDDVSGKGKNKSGCGGGWQAVHEPSRAGRGGIERDRQAEVGLCAAALLNPRIRPASGLAYLVTPDTPYGRQRKLHSVGMSGAYYKEFD